MIYARIISCTLLMALLCACGSHQAVPPDLGQLRAEAPVAAVCYAKSPGDHSPDAYRDIRSIEAEGVCFVPIRADESPAPELLRYFQISRDLETVKLITVDFPPDSFIGGYFLLAGGNSAEDCQKGGAIETEALFLAVEGQGGYLPFAALTVDGDPVIEEDGIVLQFRLIEGQPTATRAPSAVDSMIARAGAVTPHASLAPAITWQERNTGDYNLDGEVSIGDVTELGRRFGAVVGDGVDDRVESAVDGNRDGEVGLSDLTEIGRNFRNRIAGYNVYRAVAESGPWTRLAFVPRSTAAAYPGVVLYSYMDTSAVPGATAWYAFAPVDDLTGTEGVRSTPLYYCPESPGGIGGREPATSVVGNGEVSTVVIAGQLLVTASEDADYHSVYNWVYGDAGGDVLGKIPHTDTYVVEFLDDAQSAMARVNGLRSSSAAGADPVDRVEYNRVLFSSGSVVHFRDTGGYEVRQLSEMEPARERHVSKVAGDPRRSEMWHLDQININSAWDVTEGEGVMVALIDSGADAAHPDLSPNIQRTLILDDYGNAVGGSMTDGDRSYSHGTHTAGTVGAAMNDTGVVGVAPGCGLMIIRTGSEMGSGYGFTTASIAAGIYAAADAGAGVISMSLGGPADPYSDGVMRDAVDYAVARKVIVCAAAGNSNSSNDWYPQTPADLPGVISVGATGPNGYRASYSNYGDSVDVSAPGGDSYFGETGTVLSCAAGGGYRWMEGTSMACPHVAGVCALLKSVNKSLTSDSAAAILRATGQGQSDMGPLVNAIAAVNRANDGSVTPDPDPDPDVLAPPTGLTGNASVTEIYLTWDAVSGADGYHVYYGGSADTGSGWFRITTDGAVAQPRLTVTGAQAGETYYFAVTTVAGTRESRFSSVVSVTPGGEGNGLTPPVNLTATAGDGVAYLGWDAPATANLAGYHVFGSLSPDVTHRDRLTWWPLTGTETTVYHLENGVTYYFALTTVDSYWQESALSRVISVTPGQSSPAPGPDPTPDPRPTPVPTGNYAVYAGAGYANGWYFETYDGSMQLGSSGISFDGGEYNLGWCAWDTRNGWGVDRQDGSYSCVLNSDGRVAGNEYIWSDGWNLWTAEMAMAGAVIEQSGDEAFVSIYAIGWDFSEYYAEYYLVGHD